MSNDWEIIPAVEVNWSGLQVDDDEPHCLVWKFPTRTEAQRFAVKAEYINEHNLDLAAASIYLDTIKAIGTDDPTRVALAAVGEGVKTQLKLNNALALLDHACNGNAELIRKIRAVVEKIG